MFFTKIEFCISFENKDLKFRCTEMCRIVPQSRVWGKIVVKIRHIKIKV